MQDSKTRIWTRISMAALMVALLAGITLSGAYIGAQDEPVDSPKTLDDATKIAIDEAVKKALAQQNAGKPEPRRTAYVDFLTLLKADKLLAIEQQNIAEAVDKENTELEKVWGAKIQEHQRERELNKPNTHEYRQAMRNQLEAARKLYEYRLDYEQRARVDLLNFGIERFKALKNLATDIAKKAGYNEVLNIVRDMENARAQEDSFQALQQQLLISPVLYFEPEHDISDKVQAEADKLWGSNISMPDFDAASGKGGVVFTIEGAKEEVKRNAEGEIEIRLGQKGKLTASVLDKEQPAAGEKARVRWSKRGVNVGDLDDEGAYAAPEEFPVAGDTFTIIARSAVDPTVTVSVTVRLLDKDGNRMPAKEE